MSMMHSHINKTISSAIGDRCIPEIQNIMSTISSGQGDTESNASKNNQDDREMTSGLKMKITKKDSRSAFELRDTEDRSPYTLLQFLKKYFATEWMFR